MQVPVAPKQSWEDPLPIKKSKVLLFVALGSVLIAAAFWLSTKPLPPTLYRGADDSNIAACYVCAFLLIAFLGLVPDDWPLVRVAVLLSALGKAIVIPFYEGHAKNSQLLPGLAGTLLIVIAFLLRKEPKLAGQQDKEIPVAKAAGFLAVLIGIEGIAFLAKVYEVLTPVGEQNYQLIKSISVDTIGYIFLGNALCNLITYKKSTGLATLVVTIFWLYPIAEWSYCGWFLSPFHSLDGPGMPSPFLMLFTVLRSVQTIVLCAFLGIRIFSPETGKLDFEQIDRLLRNELGLLASRRRGSSPTS